LRIDVHSEYDFVRLKSPKINKKRKYLAPNPGLVPANSKPLITGWLAVRVGSFLYLNSLGCPVDESTPVHNLSLGSIRLPFDTVAEIGTWENSFFQ
jgi:hypothetical protein